MERRTWMEVLSEERCGALLAGRTVGRVGVLVDGHPEIFPVNYAWRDGRVLFRTDEGTKLHAAVEWPTVCFQVDDLDPVGQGGWSVLVVGRAAVVEDDALAGEVDPWSYGEKSALLAITPRKVTGRQLPVGS